MSKPVFWIHGNKRECRETWDQLVSHVKASGQDPNVQVVYCGINPKDALPTQRWATTSDVIELLRSKDIFDDRPRIIKIIGLSENYTEIADRLNFVNGRNVLVFWGPFGHTKVGSKRWVTAKTTKLYKKIKSEGNIVEHLTEAKSESSAVSWVSEVASEFNKSIDSGVARQIVRLSGKNLDFLSNTVEKLARYQTGKKITTEDVGACCWSEYDDKVWGFLEDLDYGNVDKALQYLHNFYAEGKGSIGENFYGRINRLFGALLQHFQLLLMLKDTCGNFLHAQQAQKELSTFRKTTPTKLKELREGKITVDDLELRFSSRYLEGQIRNPAVQNIFKRRKSDIYCILIDLHDCIYWCRKNSGDPYILKLCLDTFALVVCGKLSPDQANMIRGYNGYRFERTLDERN